MRKQVGVLGLALGLVLTGLSQPAYALDCGRLEAWARELTDRSNGGDIMPFGFRNGGRYRPGDYEKLFLNGLLTPEKSERIFGVALGAMTDEQWASFEQPVANCAASVSVKRYSPNYHRSALERLVVNGKEVNRDLAVIYAEYDRLVAIRDELSAAPKDYSGFELFVRRMKLSNDESFERWKGLRRLYVEQTIERTWENRSAYIPAFEAEIIAAVDSYRDLPAASEILERWTVPVGGRNIVTGGGWDTEAWEKELLPIIINRIAPSIPELDSRIDPLVERGDMQAFFEAEEIQLEFLDDAKVKNSLVRAFNGSYLDSRPLSRLRFRDVLDSFIDERCEEFSASLSTNLRESIVAGNSDGRRLDEFGCMLIGKGYHVSAKETQTGFLGLFGSRTLQLRAENELAHENHGSGWILYMVDSEEFTEKTGMPTGENGDWFILTSTRLDSDEDPTAFSRERAGFASQILRPEINVDRLREFVVN